MKSEASIARSSSSGDASLPLLATVLSFDPDGDPGLLGLLGASAAPQLSPYAPRITMLRIGVHRIRYLIGPGGRVIQAVQAETGTQIDVEDDGTVRIAAPNTGSLERAARLVFDLTGEPEVGKIYRGTVTDVKGFGAFVRLFEGIEGLVHVTQLAEGRVEDPSRVTAPGDEMVVEVLGVDSQGKIKLSRKQALNVPVGETENA